MPRPCNKNPQAAAERKRKIDRDRQRLARRLRRNRLIVEAYLAGTSRADIAAKYRITPRMVSRIVAEAGATLTWPDLLEIRRATNPTYAVGGRKQEIFLPSDQRRHYAKARNILGVAAAREAFGIAA